MSIGDTVYNFLMSWQTIPFIAALLVVIIFAGVELLGRIFGISLLNEIDDMHHVEFDIDPNDPDAIPPLLTWISLDRLPILLWFIVLCIGFLIPGYIINIASVLFNNTYVSLFITVPISSVIAVLTVRYTGTPISNRLRAALPSDRIVHPEYLIGEAAVIYFGTATYKKEAKARLINTARYGRFIMVKALDPKRTFSAGTEVMLVHGDNKTWYVAPSTAQISYELALKEAAEGCT